MHKRLFDGYFALGIISGITASIAFLVFCDVDSYLSTELVASIVGAILGGAIAIASQLWISQARDRQIDEAAAYSIYIKLIEIMSKLYHINQHFVEARVIQKEIGENAPLFWALRPIANEFDAVNIMQDEKSLLIKWNSFDLFNRIISIDWIYNSLLRGLRTYADRREDILEMNIPNNMEGVIGRVEMDPMQYAMYAPRAAALEDLISQIITNYDNVHIKAEEILIDFGKEIEKNLGRKIEIEIKRPIS